jgi:phosphatidate phosphatase PAH1
MNKEEREKKTKKFNKTKKKINKKRQINPEINKKQLIGKIIISTRNHNVSNNQAFLGGLVIIYLS